LSGVAFGEGAYSLLGLFVVPDDPTSLYAYHTQSRDAVIGRYLLDLSAAPGEQIAWSSWTLANDLPLPNGDARGALALGPDGTLYAGDARGAVLRMETDGETPEDSPDPGSFTYSSGFGDVVTGIAWDEVGRGWAVEDGGALRAVIPGDVSTVEPLARVEPPNGLAHVAGSLWVGAENSGLWRIPLDGQGGLSGTPERLTIAGSPVALYPAGSEELWALTAEGEILRVAVT
jgi:hypothetical protein